MAEVLARIPAKLQPLFQPSRYKVLYGGRAGAKSWGIARALLLLGGQRPLRILCAREIQKTIRDSVHSLLSDQIKALKIEHLYAVQQHEIIGRNGTVFIFTGLSTQTADSIKSYEGIDIAWIEEARSVTDKSWDILIPTIRKEGSEIWVSFNPELDTDPAYRRFVVSPPSGSVVIKMSYEDNPYLSQTIRNEIEAMRESDPEGFAHIYGGQCKPAVEGAIYYREIAAAIEERRIRSVPYDPLLQVHTVWDLGWNDFTTILLVQRLHSEVRVIGMLEGSFQRYDQWIHQLNEFRYRWGTDWLPHDARNTSQQTGKSAEEIIRSLGRKVEVIPRLDPEQGIKAARMMFPRCYFDEEKAAGLIHHLRSYRRRINQQTLAAEAPVHDDHSHAADAFRGLAVIVDRITNEKAWSKPIKYPNIGIV